MENASKALLMAGAVFIAVIIIALLVKSISNVSSFQESRLIEQEQEKIIEFNESYIRYVGTYVYGTEVASLKNKYESDKKVAVEVLPVGTQLPTNIGQDTQYYKCTGVEYNLSTGRINKITFQKVEVDSTIDDE